MPTYATLNALPPEAFLNVENFRTDFDAQHAGKAYPTEQYQTGLLTGRNAVRAGVSANGVWWARMRDDGTISSHEGIGYHACTADLWRGFLDSGCEIWIFRFDRAPTRIK